MGKKYYRKGEQHRIENYEAAKKDNFVDWDIHHRLAMDLEGNEVNSRDSLKRLDMYYNRPYFELIYLRHSEHRILHALNKTSPMKDKHHRADSKIKLSVAGKGNTNARNKPTSVFGKILKEKTGITKWSDLKAYLKEYRYFKRHNKFSWE
ncbi:MAG: hypothetical protein MJZ37_06940 [Bacilli bacterium]|nr:hypothetical protein [Bacilli bacterium]